MVVSSSIMRRESAISGGASASQYRSFSMQTRRTRAYLWLSDITSGCGDDDTWKSKVMRPAARAASSNSELVVLSRKAYLDDRRVRIALQSSHLFIQNQLGKGSSLDSVCHLPGAVMAVGHPNVCFTSQTSLKGFLDESLQFVAQIPVRL